MNAKFWGAAGLRAPAWLAVAFVAFGASACAERVAAWWPFRPWRRDP